MPEMPLKDLIVDLRQQLMEAQQQREKEEIKFSIEEVELELSIQLIESEKGETKVGISSSFGRDTNSELSLNNVQRLKLKLKPLPNADGSQYEISDQVTVD